MKKSIYLAMLVFAAAIFAACGAPATNNNKPANTNAAGNANAAKPTAAAPTKEAFIEMEKKATEAWIKGDAEHFKDMLSDKFVSYMKGKRGDKAGEIGMISTVKCESKSQAIDEGEVTKINDDTYVFTYKSTMDATCTWEGKTDKVPSPMRAASVWVRDGDKWKGAFHSETMIIDPKNPPKAAPKKEEPKKDEAKADDKKPATSANTEALVKLHLGGWEAFKAKDAKIFNDTLTQTFALVDPMGGFHGTKADIIKNWTESMDCKDINNVSVKDGVATALSPTVELLTITGSSDGTCMGQKNGDLYQTALYVKEGDAWKLAYMFEEPKM